jgi:hypothetical protein
MKLSLSAALTLALLAELASAWKCHHNYSYCGHVLNKKSTYACQETKNDFIPGCSASSLTPRAKKATANTNRSWNLLARKRTPPARANRCRTTFSSVTRIARVVRGFFWRWSARRIGVWLRGLEMTISVCMGRSQGVLLRGKDLLVGNILTVSNQVMAGR